MTYKYLTFILLLILYGCDSTTENDKKFIYYLHGRIIEIQGKNAISEAYGKYEFDKIVSALKVENSEVIAEIRSENVDYLKYAQKISKQVDSLLSSGVKPSNITIIGASKGAIIAANVANMNPNPINYVFLAGNNDYQEQHNDWEFHGQILCIYDASDTVAGKNYDYWKLKSKKVTKFEQIEISKSLGHGFLYQPYVEWINPTKNWIELQKI